MGTSLIGRAQLLSGTNDYTVSPFSYDIKDEWALTSATT